MVSPNIAPDWIYGEENFTHNKPIESCKIYFLGYFFSICMENEVNNSIHFSF